MSEKFYYEMPIDTCPPPKLNYILTEFVGFCGDSTPEMRRKFLSTMAQKPRGRNSNREKHGAKDTKRYSELLIFSIRSYIDDGTTKIATRSFLIISCLFLIENKEN